MLICFPGTLSLVADVIYFAFHKLCRLMENICMVVTFTSFRSQCFGTKGKLLLSVFIF